MKLGVLGVLYLVGYSPVRVKSETTSRYYCYWVMFPLVSSGNPVAILGILIPLLVFNSALMFVTICPSVSRSCWWIQFIFGIQVQHLSVEK